MANNCWLYTNTDTTEVLLQVTVSELCSNNKEVDCSSLKSYHTVGSYNRCLESTPEKPVIIIPGRPSYLKQTLEIQQLKKISYSYISDENKFHYPEYPIEPIFRSVLKCTPEFDFQQVDIILDRGILRMLNSVVDGDDLNSWRVDFQRIGNSIVLFRHDQHNKHQYDDFSQGFTEKVTSDKRREFKKIVSYELGPLKILQRFEADYVESNQDTELDDLISPMLKVDINNNPISAKKYPDSNLSFIEDGQFDQLNNTVEFATRCSVKNRFPEKKWNMLFFTLSDSLVLGWHNRGMLEKIEKLSFTEVSKRCKRTKENIHVSMSTLTDLLNKFKEFGMAQEADGTLYSAVYDNTKTNTNNSIKIYKSIVSMQCLPKDLMMNIYS